MHPRAMVFHMCGSHHIALMTVTLASIFDFTTRFFYAIQINIVLDYLDILILKKIQHISEQKCILKNSN